jgi:hypothetical protein
MDKAVRVNTQAGPTNPIEGHLVKLALADDVASTAIVASWAGHFVALGAKVRKYALEFPGEQLVVVVSVPQRDYAAVLLGCGWVLGRSAQQVNARADALGDLKPGEGVRLVTDHRVLWDTFVRIVDGPDPAVELSATKWLVSSVTAVSPAPVPPEPTAGARPEVGSLGRWARLELTWNERLATPEDDLAIIGTRAWLERDGGALLAVESDLQGHGSAARVRDDVGTISNLLLPWRVGAPTWFSRFLSAAGLADYLPLSRSFRAVILDGGSAVRYLPDVTAPVVMCVVDRSVLDETSAEMLVQFRNSRGEPKRIRESLGWWPPAGVEALAFTVPL